MRRGGFDPSIVYMSTGRLLLHPPGVVAFHRWDHGHPKDEWPRYIPDPDNPPFAKVDPERDRERHFTACGLVTYDSRYHRKTVLDGIRRDNAELVGRPCMRCFP